MTKLVGIVGTNSKESTNRKLLEYIEVAFFYKVDMEVLEIKDVPLMDYWNKKEFPDSVLNIAKKIEEADGVIIATPEYDHAPTASLMNLLAWLSYKIHPLSRKPVMIVGASHGALGSSRAQSILRQILKSPEINARVMSTEFLLGFSQKAYDSWGDLKGRDKIQEMEKVFDEFIQFIGIVNNTNDEELINIHEFDNFKWDEIDWRKE